MKKICVLGSSGFIGQALVKKLKEKDYQVLEASLRKDRGWESKILESDAVVNLAGEPIFGKRWNTYVKGDIFDSRVHGTEEIVEALGRAQAKNTAPKVFVCASAIGIYGSRKEEVLSEDSQLGADFLAFVCRHWEEAALKAQQRYGVRTVVLRFGVVLGKDGGALKQMLLPFKLGLGGPINFGKQWFSWIHLDDVVGIILHALEKDLQGPFNTVSPHPVRNNEYSRTLGRVLKRPAFMPLPGFMLRLLFGEASEVLTAGQRVSAEKILESGYQFQHPHLEEALKSFRFR
jgi:uncharacterized protein